MASSAAESVEQYLAELPPERVELVTALRDTVNAHLPDGYQEAMQYGMIGWSVPHDRYPAGYHTDPAQPVPYAALASQKQYVSLYLMGLYTPGPADDPSEGDPADARWFREAWAATGRTLNMGASCVRVKRLDDVAFDVVGEAIARLPVDEFLERYEAVRPAPRRR